MSRRHILPFQQFHYDPFLPAREMHRLFQDALEKNPEQGAQAPAIDILEHDNAFIVKADLPSCDPNDIDISVSGNTLTIRTEKNRESDRKEGNYVVQERSYGLFQRSIALPNHIDANKINAAFKNGTVTVTIPKKTEDTSRKITLNTER